ncbi:hypothetical protein SO802_017513 [Lithocarpus litseifolius]|uniref:Uncharacterized protein n=1 Tax=Lithocarpus litseifolius TaxID=425828 RepID=A0AAW2CI75_9ROSI
MLLTDLYALLLERKLVTPMFYRPREGPPALGFDSSKKCEHYFKVEGHTFEECYHLKDHIQDLMDNKLIQFNNVSTPNILTNPLPPHREGNVNAIIVVEERVLDFSSPTFPWKAMLRALVRDSHLDLKGMGTPGFDWGICSFCDHKDSYALFDFQVTLTPPSSVDVEEIIEALAYSRSSDLGKGKTSPTIRGFAPLVLALPTVARLTPSSVQEGIAIVPTIRGFDPLILLDSGIFEVHHNAILKVLKETCVLTSAIEFTFKGMVSTVLATNQTSFMDEDLPPEGRDHTFPMHIMVKSEDMIIAKVLIDNGSALNVCPMSTLERLNVDTFLIHPTTMIIRAFDGTLQEVQGQGLGAVGHGKASLVELLDNKGGFNLGYDPFDEELFQAFRGKKRKCIGQGMSIPHIKVTFLALAKVIRSEVAQDSYEEESNLACLIRLWPEE